MENCVQKLYNPEDRKSFRQLGHGAAKVAYDMNNGYVIKFLKKRTFYEHKELFTKQYDNSNIHEFIDELIKNDSLNECQKTDLLPSLEQVFAEWNLWNNATPEERTVLGTIVEMGYDENNLPYTIMEKADEIVEDIIYTQTPEFIGAPHKITIESNCCACDCNFNFNCDVEVCRLCKNWIPQHRTYDEDEYSDDLDRFNYLLENTELYFDFDEYYTLADKYQLGDVLCNFTNVGVFNNVAKVIDFGYVNHLDSYRDIYYKKKKILF
jgi:hypothetical protein